MLAVIERSDVPGIRLCYKKFKKIMKRIALVFLLACWALGASAQEKRLTVEKVKKGEEPEKVMEAIKTDFPGAITKDLSFLPAKLYGEEWNVDLQGDEVNDVKYYQVDIKAENRDYTAVYDAKGDLLSSKQVIHNAKLPPPINEALKKFQGWHIDKSHEIIKYSGKHSSDTYRVKMQKGGQHKNVYLDANGNIINTKFSLI